MEEEARTFVFQGDESELDAIQLIVAEHPKVSYAEVEAGRWYSNGEDGPEWHRMLVKCRPSDNEEVQAFIRAKLASHGRSTVQFHQW